MSSWFLSRESRALTIFFQRETERERQGEGFLSLSCFSFVGVAGVGWGKGVGEGGGGGVFHVMGANKGMQGMCSMAGKAYK